MPVAQRHRASSSGKAQRSASQETRRHLFNRSPGGSTRERIRWRDVHRILSTLGRTQLTLSMSALACPAVSLPSVGTSPPFRQLPLRLQLSSNLTHENACLWLRDCSSRFRYNRYRTRSCGRRHSPHRRAFRVQRCEPRSCHRLERVAHERQRRYRNAFLARSERFAFAAARPKRQVTFSDRMGD